MSDPIASLVRAIEHLTVMHNPPKAIAYTVLALVQMRREVSSDDLRRATDIFK